MELSGSPLAAAAVAWPAIWLADTLRYLITAGTLALVLGLLPARSLAPRNVRIRQVAPRQRRQEIWRSLVTALIFSLNGAVVLAGAQAGVLRLYTDPGQYSHAWLAASLVLLVGVPSFSVQ